MTARTRWLPWLSVVGLLVLSGLAAGLSVLRAPGSSRATPTPVPVAPLTGFGGYTWFGPTTSVAARWDVPKIVSRGHSSAATWIGAQDPSGTFVQVGTLEFRPASGPPHYEAFWSDTALGFHAQPLHSVRPSDVVSAVLFERAGGWYLSVADTTGHWSQDLATHYQGPHPFAQGEWVQEDPAPALITATDVPYPHTTVVRFSQVRVNGTVPTLPYDNARALSAEGGVYLVPTRFQDDGFSLPPAQGAALRYLVVAGRYDRVVSEAATVLVTGPQPTPPSRRAEAATEIIGAERRLVADLESGTWPAVASDDIATVTRDTQPVIDDNRRLQDTHFVETAGFSERIQRDELRLRIAVDAARSDLGLPPV